MHPIGIDIGRESIMIATTRREHPFEINMIDGKDPLWWQQLDDLAPTHAALEPTGYAYSIPVVRHLHMRGCVVYYVNHAISGHLRQAFISKHKTDRLNAIGFRCRESETRKIRWDDSG